MAAPRRSGTRADRTPRARSTSPVAKTRRDPRADEERPGDEGRAHAREPPPRASAELRTRSRRRARRRRSAPSPRAKTTATVKRVQSQWPRSRRATAPASPADSPSRHSTFSLHSYCVHLTLPSRGPVGEDHPPGSDRWRRQRRRGNCEHPARRARRPAHQLSGGAGHGCEPSQASGGTVGQIRLHSHRATCKVSQRNRNNERGRRHGSAG